MFINSVFQITLVLATLLCSLVTGFILIFAIVVMPGIGTLSNRDFLRAFQVIDGIIQNNQPVFILIWIGSLLALVAATLMGLGQLVGLSRLLIILAASIYIFGVHLPTFRINIPLNNRVQALNLDELDEAKLIAERSHFETRWNRWNAIRTAFASLTSIILTIILLIH